MAALLEKMVRIEGDDTGLVWLSNVCKNAVNHAHEHSVLVRVSGVLDNRNNICPRLGHVEQISSRAVRELDSVDESFRADDVGNMGHSGPRGGAQVKDLILF